MQIELIKYIFLFLMGSSVLNFVIALMIRYKTKNKAFNILIGYWPAIILTFLAAAALGQSPTQIAIAYFFQIISSNLIVKMMCSAQGIQFRWPIYISIQLFTMAMAVLLLTQFQIDFTTAVLPVSIAFALPFISPIWHSLVSNRKESSWIEKTMGVVFITGMINHLNYALFRMDPNAAFWGWSVSIAQYQCLSLFLPMLINYRREENEKSQLKQAIQKLSGNLIQTSKTEELYSQLEYEISEKDRFSTSLKKTNLQLDEEREMNEILFRAISHDLANPLSAIKMTVQKLQTKKLNEEDLQKSLALLDRSSQSAISMITNARKAIMAKSQGQLVVMNSVSATKCIELLKQSFEQRLKEKNIQFEIINQLTTSDLISANEEALVDHVFSNILSNSIKFSHQNSRIVLRIQEAQDQIEISFQDSGIGFKKSANKQDSSISRPGTMGEKGTGFGLAITSYFMRHFEGSLSIQSYESGPSQGTIVTLLFNKIHAKTTFAPTPASQIEKRMPTF